MAVCQEVALIQQDHPETYLHIVSSLLSLEDATESTFNELLQRIAEAAGTSIRHACRAMQSPRRSQVFGSHSALQCIAVEALTTLVETSLTRAVGSGMFCNAWCNDRIRT